MHPATKNAITILAMLADRKYVAAAIEVHTSDGRDWSINTSEFGGFRLYEIPHDGRLPIEHDAVEADLWEAGDMLDYLAAITVPHEPETTPRCSCDPCKDAAAKTVRVNGWLICSRCAGRIGAGR